MVGVTATPFITGTWSQTNNQVRLRSTDNGTVVLVATLVGSDLRHGYEIVIPPPHNGPVSRLPIIMVKQSWYAIRS